MTKIDLWSTIDGERKALAADLQGIADDQWSVRSLCSEWTVRDVAEHRQRAPVVGWRRR